MTIKGLALGGAAIAALAAPAFAQEQKPAPVATLIKAVDIPYQQFTLNNGLRVVVSTDRKAQIVAVSVWYNVGAKFEPAGKTGFAHLFEHLMFNGSENAPGDFFEPLKQVGATDFNGTTNLDRTNYFETVPIAALPRALFLESDRMGHLTGAITQGVLDEQRGVVQNEKRQGDNQPYGLTQYKVTEGLFPATHPYGHTTIGSMADLDAASLQTVKDWFHDHYGPNNAVLVLAGDVDVATARTLVEKYFGDIPRGPASAAPPAPIPTLPAPVNETMKDRVAAVAISRNWAVPGVNDKESSSLDVAAAVLAGGQSSRLYNQLVRQEKLLTGVNAYNQSYSQLGVFTIRGFVRPGVDPALAARRMDEIVADFLKNGPTADEVSRVVTRDTAATIRGLEAVGGFGGKAVTLAEGALYSNDPGFYRKQLAELAAQTPASVRAAAAKWLGRPAYALTVEPGPRDAYADAQVPSTKPVVAAPDLPAKGARGPLPAVGDVAGLSFPTVERARLSNGIEVVYARRTAVPITQFVLSFDAGVAADVPGKLGTGHFAVDMLDEGTASRTGPQIAEEEERLGMQLNAAQTLDRTNVYVEVPSANMLPALDLFADVVRRPAFADAEVARVKQQELAGIAQELTNPNGLAVRAYPPLLYGASPYAKAQGNGDPKAVAALTPADLRAFHATWLRPDKAKMFVTSDRPLAEVKAALDKAFGDWQATGAAGTKSFAAATPASPRIVLVDRPDSPQSVIIGAIPNTLVGTQDLLPVNTANDALGGSFLGRINMDLREGKHWSYGVSGSFRQAEHAAPYVLSAPVQANQTGPSIAALRGDLTAFVSTEPMSKVEFDRAITGAIRELPGRFETSGAVIAAMQANDLYKRPDDYYATITTRYRALTLPQLNTALQGSLDPKKAIWIVVGDAKTVKPQLDTLGLPVEVVAAASVAGAQ